MKKYIKYGIPIFIGLNLIHFELKKSYPSIKRYNLKKNNYEVIHSYCIFGPKNELIRDVKKICDIINYISK
jgi:hypothetical protein